MGETTMLAVATASFVGTHLVLSHPLRASLVGAMGEKAFLGLYSLVAAVTLGWMIWAANQVPQQAPLWAAPRGLWDVTTLVMLIAAILLVGSLIGNPALPDPTGNPQFPDEPRGVYAITRHPMMWSFMLWAVMHALLWPSPANLIVTGGIGLLALVGALGQDAKKTRLIGQPWKDWQTRTSFVPFGAQLSGKLGWRATLPPVGVVAGAVLLWLGATWAHAILGGPVAGPWLWIGQ